MVWRNAGSTPCCNRLCAQQSPAVFQTCLYLSRVKPLLTQEFMMGIASFSPRVGRASGLSLLLAPIQAFAALFVPIRPSVPHARQAPNPNRAYRAAAFAPQSLNTTRANTVRVTAPAAPVQRLKIVRQFEPGTNRSCSGRLVISGRMSDVCAELDRMAG